MTVIAINKEDNTDFFVAVDKVEATKMVAGGMKHYEIIQSADHLGASELVNTQWFLTTLNNRLPEDKQVKKFADKKSAAKRVWNALMTEFEDAGIEPAPVVEPKAEPKGKKAKAPKAPKEPKERKPSPRDRAMWAKDIPMPYRDNTASGATWRMLQSNPGKSFKELSAMGARENTLADGIKRGFIAFSEAEI